MSQASVEETVNRFRQVLGRLQSEMSQMIVGQSGIIRGVLTALLANGNVLLEGVPGLGKTQLVKTLAEVIDIDFSRIQFTPDLMPADIIGTNMVLETQSGQRTFSFQQGPIFANIVLADEINRATPKTQSALLEAMQEHRVTVGGTTYPLDAPFLVLATQNPLEMEGTYPLPEAQVDRFMLKLNVPFPDLDELTLISSRTTGENWPEVRQVANKTDILDMRDVVKAVPIAPHVERYAARLVLATHPDKPQSVNETRRYVRYGCSPRGLQSLVLAGKVSALLDQRFAVSCDDIRRVTHPALRHRLILNFEGEAEGIHPDHILDKILDAVPETEQAVASSR